MKTPINLSASIQGMPNNSSVLGLVALTALPRGRARRVLRNLAISLCCLFQVSPGAQGATVGWTPPEASVTPPAVLTLDVFSGPDWNGAHPNARLVKGPDGAMYGSTPAGYSSTRGTLFRLETNGSFTKLHDFSGFEAFGLTAALVLGL